MIKLQLTILLMGIMGYILAVLSDNSWFLLIECAGILGMSDKLCWEISALMGIGNAKDQN